MDNTQGVAVLYVALVGALCLASWYLPGWY